MCTCMQSSLNILHRGCVVALLLEWHFLLDIFTFRRLASAKIPQNWIWFSSAAALWWGQSQGHLEWLRKEIKRQCNTEDDITSGDVVFVCKCGFWMWILERQLPSILPKNVYQKNIPGSTFIQDLFQLLKSERTSVLFCFIPTFIIYYMTPPVYPGPPVVIEPCSSHQNLQTDPFLTATRPQAEYSEPWACSSI